MSYSVKRAQTRQKIDEVFLALFKEKPLAQITVKEICAQAQINRSTFYTYYVDVIALHDHLADETMQEMIAAMRQIFEQQPDWDIMEIVPALIQVLQTSDGRAFLFMVRNREDWIRRIIEALKNGLVFDVQRLSADALARLDCVMEYHLSGALAIISRALLVHSEQDIDNLLQLLAEIGTRGPLTMLKEMVTEER